MFRTLVFLFSSCIAATAFADAELIVLGESRNAQRVDPGTTATYQALVRNLGPDTANNLRLRLELPPQSRLMSVQGLGSWNCDGTDAEVNCTLSSMAVTLLSDTPSGVIATVTLSSDPNGQIVTTHATLTSDTPNPLAFANETSFLTVIYHLLTVTSTADSGPDSLRAKIDEANSTCDNDVPCKMKLDLPEHSTIEPLTPLPAIRGRSLRIDGSGELEGDRRVELSGVHLSHGNGLEVFSNLDPNRPDPWHTVYVEIFGLAINRFPDYGVATLGDGDATVYFEGLFVGTDVTGTIARPNGRGFGLFAPRMIVGIGHSLISGNIHSGIFDANSRLAGVYESLIGVGSDGRALGNGNSGVFIYRGESAISVCTIANNGGFGVSIAYNALAAISSNSIYANGIGIDWGLDGPSSGLSERRIPDPPTITDAVYDAGRNETVITGTFDRASAFWPLIVVEVFANSARDNHGHAEGARFLKGIFSDTLTFTVRATGDLRGQIITATLSLGPWLDSGPKMTSEFSEGVVAR